MSVLSFKAVGVASLVFLVGGHFAYQDWYAKPAKAAIDQQARLQSDLDTTRDKSRELMEKLTASSIGPQFCLGKDVDRVTLNLRRLLTSLTEAVGATAPRIDTRDRGGVLNPASAERLDAFREGRSRRPISSFSVVVAELSASLTMDQTLLLASRIREQPVPLRITRWRVQTSQEGRAVLRATIEAAWVANDTRDVLEGPVPQTSNALGESDLQRVTEAFRMYTPPPQVQPKPAPRVEEKPQAPPQPPPPPPLTYWKLTAVVATPSGAEMWIQNTGTNERKILNSGQAIHNLIFVQIHGPDALVRIDGEQRLIKLGELLINSEPSPAIN